MRSQTDAAAGVTAEDMAQHAKGNDDKKAIITKELNSYLRGLL